MHVVVQSVRLQYLCDVRVVVARALLVEEAQDGVNEVAAMTTNLFPAASLLVAVT